MKTEPLSKFISVKCTDCGNTQTIFDRSNTKISCTVCGSTIATPSGGKAVVKGELVGRIDAKE
jgi:small subunit ribosomal protein S27e